MRYYFLLIILFFFACNNPPTEGLKNVRKTRIVVAEKIISPEQRALENKIANRTLLQQVIDTSEKLQRTHINYECDNQSGGILTIIKDKEELKGIRFAATSIGWNKFLSYYYNKNKLAFVVHERGEWEGNQEKTVQTLFYLDSNTVFRCLRKTVAGESIKIEQFIKEARFEIIETDEVLLEQLKKQEAILGARATQASITKLYCN